MWRRWLGGEDEILGLVKAMAVGLSGHAPVQEEDLE